MILIKGIASLGAAMLIGLSAPSARAGYVVDLTEHAAGVLATGSGAIDLTGLSVFGESTGHPIIAISPSDEFIVTGSPDLASWSAYIGLTGPASFGSGGFTFANVGGGDIVGMQTDNELQVPAGYVSNSPLKSFAAWNGQTFMSLGATPGTYKWTWGSGANQNFTLVIGAVVPEPSTWAMMLIGFAGLGFIGCQSAGRRRRTTGNA